MIDDLDRLPGAVCSFGCLRKRPLLLLPARQLPEHHTQPSPPSRFRSVREGGGERGSGAEWRVPGERRGRKTARLTVVADGGRGGSCLRDGRSCARARNAAPGRSRGR